MKSINKEKLKTITLWIGILTALLLIIGTFSMTGGSGVSDNLFSWLYQTAPLAEVVEFSTNVIRSLSSLGL